MILGDFLRALGQLHDRRFQKVVGLGVLLSLALLAGAYVVVAWLVGWFVPDSFTLPWLGEVTWVNDLASWGSLLVMLFLSVFLMVPVASAFTGVFLDEVADAVLEQTGIELDRKDLQLDEHIKDLGTHHVVARLHTDVQFPITIEVVEG